MKLIKENIKFSVYFIILLLFFIYKAWSCFSGDLLVAIGTEEVLSYLFVGTWIFGGLVFVLIKYVKDLNWKIVLFLYSLFYILQIEIYLFYRPFCWELLTPLIVFVAIWIYIFVMRKRRKSRRCECGELCPFEIYSGKADDDKHIEYYCHKHFIHELRKCFFEYDGHFILMSASPKDDENGAQYLFYAPEDLSIDDYPETDIESVKDIIKAAFESNKQMAVKIPADAVKNIDDFEDTPLFTKPITYIEMQPMDKESFLSYIERETIRYDSEKKIFGINKPYAKTGIYIWHNYL